MTNGAKLGSVLLAAALSAQAGGSEPAPQPIRLVAEASEAEVVLRVVGEATSPVAAEYSLEVDSGATPGGNRSRQSGRVDLPANKQVVLLTTRLAGAAAKNWRAHLKVTPSPGAVYEVRRSSEG